MRKMFKVPPLVKHDKKALPASKGFVKVSPLSTGGEIISEAYICPLEAKKISPVSALFTGNEGLFYQCEAVE